MKYDIFISYRREGGYDTAKHLNDLLVEMAIESVLILTH